MPFDYQLALPIILGVAALMTAAWSLVGWQINVFNPDVGIEANQALWIRVLAIQFSLWLVSSFFSCLLICELWRKFHHPLWDLVAIGVSVGALVCLSLMGPIIKKGELDRVERTHVSKTLFKYFTFCGGMFALLPISGLMLAGVGAAQLTHTAQFTNATDSIVAFQQLRSITDGLLILSSLLLTAAAAGIDLRRRAVNALHPSERAAGQGHALNFGIIYTFLLALVYIPIGIAISRAGDAILAHALKGAESDLRMWLDMRKRVSEALALGDAGLPPPAALTVIGPLAGGLLATLFGKDPGESANKE